VAAQELSKLDPLVLGALLISWHYQIPNNDRIAFTTHQDKKSISKVCLKE